jgi:hypothetical protein
MYNRESLAPVQLLDFHNIYHSKNKDQLYLEMEGLLLKLLQFSFEHLTTPHILVRYFVRDENI